jgi:hypothetical protein
MARIGSQTRCLNRAARAGTGVRVISRQALPILAPAADGIASGPIVRSGIVI